MLKLIATLLLLSGCASITIPDDYIYTEISTSSFTLASWQKITSSDSPYKIYIEGDGHAFNHRGKTTRDPTPKGTLMREIAFNDKSPNVIYLARPCQYIKSPICSKRHWSTARFSPEVITAEYEAIKNITSNNPTILIGFSGGAQVAGLVATAKPDLNIKKIITIAGNLDHTSWTQHHNLPPLSESMDLASYHKQFMQIPQTHYVGGKDKVTPPIITQKFINNPQQIIQIDNASHNTGWEGIYQSIWNTQIN